MWKSSIFSNIEVWEPVTLRKHLLYKIFFTDVSGEIGIKTQEKYKSKKKKKRVKYHCFQYVFATFPLCNFFNVCFDPILHGIFDGR